MIWQSLLLGIVFSQTSSTCPSNWKASVGKTCTGTPVCQYDPFCCCPKEQLEADKMCVMVNNLFCKNGKWVFKETAPPPCIIYPDFKCPSASSDSSGDSFSFDGSGSDSEPLTAPVLPVVLPLDPKPEPCYYRLDCQNIVCPAACGGGVATITCPVVNFKPATNGGYCDAVEGGTMTIDCVNAQACPATATAAVPCAWDRFCGTDDQAWLYPCVAECGGGVGYRECEVRNFIPAKNGGTCKRSRSSEQILRSCTNTDPCPVDCSFELVCEEVCNGRCGTKGWKTCKVKNFVPANEVGRCNLTANAQLEGAEVMETCATPSCAEACPKSMQDYRKHKHTDYATCAGERTCTYDEFCCCPSETLQEDKGCQHVNHLTCKAGKWTFTKSQPPSCVTDPLHFVCPSEPGGKYCVTCPKDLPDCDASCTYPSYCKYEKATCTSCPKATCIPPPDCSATTCTADLMKLGAACKSKNEYVLAPNGECCGKCVPKKCYSDDECPAGFCARQPGDCEGKGFCQPAPNPMVCMSDAQTRPVCGCDGQTYQSGCLANSALTNIKILSACPKVASTTTGIKLTWVEDIYPVLLTLNLQQGHGQGGAAAQMLSMGDVLESFNNVVRVQSKQAGGMDLIKPCDAAGSYLYLKMAGTHGILGSIMPPDGSASEDFLALLASWINEGALYDKTSTAATCTTTLSVVAKVAPPGQCPKSMIDWRKHKNDNKYAVCSGSLTCSYDEFCCCPEEDEQANRECVNANVLDCVNGKWEYRMAELPACLTNPAFMCAAKKAQYAVGIPNSELCPADLGSWQASASKWTQEGMPLVPCTEQGLQCRYDEFCCCPDEGLDADKHCMMTNNLFCVNGFWNYQASPPPPCYADPNFLCAAEA